LGQGRVQSVGKGSRVSVKEHDVSRKIQIRKKIGRGSRKRGSDETFIVIVKERKELGEADNFLKKKARKHRDLLKTGPLSGLKKEGRGRPTGEKICP